MRRYPTGRKGQALTPSLLDLLAAGWGGIGIHEGEADAFAPWALSEAQLETLYRQHARAVEAEARRRGRVRSWAAEQFTGPDAA